MLCLGCFDLFGVCVCIGMYWEHAPVCGFTLATFGETKVALVCLRNDMCLYVKCRGFVTQRLDKARTEIGGRFHLKTLEYSGLCCVVVESFQQTHRVSVGPRCHIFVMCRQDSSAWDKN